MTAVAVTGTALRYVAEELREIAREFLADEIVCVEGMLGMLGTLCADRSAGPAATPARKAKGWRGGPNTHPL